MRLYVTLLIAVLFLLLCVEGRHHSKKHSRAVRSNGESLNSDASLNESETHKKRKRHRKHKRSNDFSITSINQLYKGLRNPASKVGEYFYKFKRDIYDQSSTAFPEVKGISVSKRISMRQLVDFAYGLPKQKVADKLFVYQLVLQHVIENYANKAIFLSSMASNLRSLTYKVEKSGNTVRHKVISKLDQISSVIQGLDEPNDVKTISNAKCLIDTAVVYDKMHDYGNEVKKYKEGAILMKNNFEEPERYDVYRWSLFNAGMVLHRLLEKHEKSLSWFNRAIAAYEKASTLELEEGVDEWYASAFYNKGQALMNLDRWDEAVVNLRKAIDVLQSVTNALVSENYKKHWIEMAEFDIRRCKDASFALKNKMKNT